MKIHLRHLAKRQLWAPVDPGLLIAALLALFAIVPLLTHSGLPNTADGPVHLMRQAELNQAWQDGILYPRWAPDLAFGYGMPLFHYAPPLLYYVTQVIHLSGLPLDVSMKGTLVLMMLLYSVGMYLFARDLFGPRAGLLAAAAYLYAPYRLREAYIQGNYGQFCGLAFYPLILWSFLGLITTRRSRYLPLAALSLAGLLLSHNISAMIFGPLLAAYLVFLWVAAQPPRRSDGQEKRPLDSATSNFLRSVGAIGLGLGLSAFFWLPAFGERDLIRLAGITSGFFDFRHNFIDLSELMALPRPLDLSAINPHYPLSLGLAQIALTGLALLGLGLNYLLRTGNGGASAVDEQVARTRRRATYQVLFFAAALLTSGFLTLPYSRPIWETVPLLELAEFPWRFLGPALLCASVLTGAALYLFERPGAGQGGLGKLAAGLLFTLAASLFYLFPAQFIPWGTPSPADALAYEAESGAIGTTSTGEFLPRWADRYPSPEVLGPDYAAGRLPTKLNPTSLPGGGRATTLSHTARETRVNVSSPDPFVGTFRALYWPGWRVIVTEGTARNEYQVTDIQITQPDGLFRVQLPAGEYQVSLRLFPTPIRLVATIISVLALVVLMGLCLVQVVNGRSGGWKAWKRPRCKGVSNQELPPFQAIVIGSGLVVGLLVTRPMAKWFRAQSPPDTVYGVQHVLRTDFGGQIRLLGFDLDAERSMKGGAIDSPVPTLPEAQAKAGGTLPAVLYWRALESLSADYSVFLHLDAPNGETYGGVDELNPEDIPTSNWPPSLYLRNPLSMALPSDLPPIRYTLTVGLYDAHSGERLPVSGCVGCSTIKDLGDAFPLAHVWLLSPRPVDEKNITRRLDYRLGDEIILLGYDLSETDPATLTLFWRTDAPVRGEYRVFIHNLGADGQVVAQSDTGPMNGLYPTYAWLPDQIIADSHSIGLAESTRALAIGLYDPVSQGRLMVIDASGERLPQDAILLQVAGDR
jgi:hypothetical protein